MPPARRSAARGNPAAAHPPRCFAKRGIQPADDWPGAEGRPRSPSIVSGVHLSMPSGPGYPASGAPWSHLWLDATTTVRPVGPKPSTTTGVRPIRRGLLQQGHSTGNRLPRPPKFLPPTSPAAMPGNQSASRESNSATRPPPGGCLRWLTGPTRFGPRATRRTRR